jgi:hypothetical protein
VVLTLALGIAATTAVFSMLRSVEQSGNPRVPDCGFDELPFEATSMESDETTPEEAARMMAAPYFAGARRRHDG